MTSVITTRGLTKQFKTHIAVDSLNLDVPQGEVYGFPRPEWIGQVDHDEDAARSDPAQQR